MYDVTPVAPTYADDKPRQRASSARASPLRVGVIGSGNIALRLVRHLQDQSDAVLAFAHARNTDALRPSAGEALLPDLDQFTERQPDLVVEAAHPAYVRDWGERILEHASLLPLSVSALGDDDVCNRLLSAARAHRTTVLIPRGALVGLDGISASTWDEVSIEFVKHPSSIGLEQFGRIEPTEGRQILYDGSARGISKVFPRNINAMVALALASTGLDRCRCRMVADASVDGASLEIVARRSDGHELHIIKREPMLGVSGEYLFDSVVQSLDGVVRPWRTMQFV